MNPTKRSAALTILMILLIILLPVLTGAIGLILEDDLPGSDDDFSFIDDFVLILVRVPVDQLASGLMLGLSVFALFGVYVGGRSSHKWFNDRTIDSNIFSVCVALILKTALLRAVFNFLFAFSPNCPNKHVARLFFQSYSQFSTEGGTQL